MTTVIVPAVTEESANEGLEVHRYNVDVSYESEDERVIVDNAEVARIQRRRFRFRADKEFFRSCLTYGATSVAIGATLYFLKDKFSTHAIPIASHSVIFEVVVPKKGTRRFEELMQKGRIESLLQSTFLDIEKNISSVLGEKWQQDLNPDELEKLKKIRISSVKLCTQDEVDKALDDLENEMDAKTDKSAEILNEQPVPAPKNIGVQENPKFPSTSLLASYEKPEGEKIDTFVVAAQNLDEASDMVQVPTTEEYAVIRGLTPGESYLISVQSVRNGKKSAKKLLRDPIRMAQYDPYPWRSWDAASTTHDSAIGSSISEFPKTESQIGESVTKDDTEESQDPILWKSDLHLALQKILRVRFSDDKMKLLLCKCDELGFVEAKDLKYLESKDIADELKATIKPVEILKLVDYAKGESISSARNLYH